ncbi:SWIM zinc finger domain-containing protein [Phytophthora infestans]|uniref:SWIM zinc finger domain-containing protein n=1 Tax=Phytophthora infestans TaxID=4787 RepID=A0A8S9TNJ3_PHYIN|nr:SWIM zinc finger domain-containing protein [Phytophthora infestans]
MDVPSTGPTTLGVKTGSTISLAKGMQFAQRKEATLHIKNFAQAQGKRAITCQAKSGGNNRLYVCASKTNCSFHTQLIKSQRQNYFEYHISSLNVAHEGCSGTVKVTAASSRGMMYRVREVLMEDTSLDYAEGCKRVQSLLVLFKRGNPTSYIDIEYTADNRFRRAFLSHPDVHLLGETSQAVIGLDGAFLKHKGADNTILIFVGRNGNLENIILAVAICPSEDEYCTWHIIGNMNAKFRGQVTQYVENWVWGVQGAVSKPDFESKIAAFAIAGLSTSMFCPKRYTDGERQTSWSRRTPRLFTIEVGIQLFFQYFTEKWMLTKLKRFDQARKWLDAGKKVTPKTKESMSEQAENARYHDISLSNEDVGFVRDMRGFPPVRRRVKLLERTCTCSFFYQYGIPCSHIYSMLAFIDQPERIFDFFDRCYLVETYMRANDAATSNIELVLDDHI